MCNINQLDIEISNTLTFMNLTAKEKKSGSYKEGNKGRNISDVCMRGRLKQTCGVVSFFNHHIFSHQKGVLTSPVHLFSVNGCLRVEQDKSNTRATMTIICTPICSVQPWATNFSLDQSRVDTIYCRRR